MSRLLAVRVITSVLKDREPLDEVLASLSSACSEQEFRWLYDVCSGTLRWKGRLDWILDGVSIRKKPSGWLRKVLLTAIYQLIAQDRASTNLILSDVLSDVRQKEGDAPARFSYACLKKVLQNVQKWRELECSSFQDMFYWSSLPLWFWNKLVDSYGAEWASIFSTACIERPELWIRSKKENSFRVIPGTQKGKITEWPGFKDGDFFVQDISNQILINEVTELVSPKKFKTVLDLCAAPGGKAVGLSWNGYEVSATDHDEKRIALLKETVRRLAPCISIIPWQDIEKKSEKKFDLTWVDAPCSGSGIIRRHPEIRWLRQEKELIHLVKIQKNLLDLAWKKTKEGGAILYSVCSIFKEEGLSHLEYFFHSYSKSELKKEWLFSPHLPPYGDGLWAALIFKK